MRQMTKAILLSAVVAAVPLGCTTSESPQVRQRPGIEEGVYRKPPYVEPAPRAVAKDIPLYGSSGDGVQPGAADEGPPPVDTTGIRLGELPSVRQATVAPQHWQRAAEVVEAKIDAPELKRNVREGLSALAPRVARALIDFKGETAIVTVAVYRDTNPTTQPAAVPATNPATAPATQPVYNHAAVAIAFEGFAGQLDPSYIPRVLADQPRTPDDGREPIDFTLELDRDATSYLFYQLTPDGLMAAQVGHGELRRELADAAQKAPSATRPAGATGPSSAADVAGQYVPVPSGCGGVVYDSGEPYRYGGYVYNGPDYYWGTGADPYLYDLYGCRWGSPYFVTRSGYYWDDYYYGSGFYYGGGFHRRHNRHGHDHDHDRGPRRAGEPRPPIVTVDGGSRGRVPWSNPPVVSRSNPPSTADRSPTPLLIPAQRGSAAAGSPTAGSPAAGSPTAGRPAPTITGRPMREPTEFVGPRSLESAGNDRSSAGYRRADGSVLKVQESGDGNTTASSPPPIVLPPRQSSSPFVVPPRSTPPVAERPANRGSSASERINSAPRLGPASNGRREFVGPRVGSGSSSPSNARSISGGNAGGSRGSAISGSRSGGGGDSGSRGSGGSGGSGGGGRSGGGGGGGSGGRSGGDGDGGGGGRGNR